MSRGKLLVAVLELGPKRVSLVGGILQLLLQRSFDLKKLVVLVLLYASSSEEGYKDSGCDARCGKEACHEQNPVLLR